MRTEPKNENWGIFHLNAKAFFVVGTLALTLMESGISILSVSADTVDTSWSNKYTVCNMCNHTPACQKSSRSAYYNYTNYVSSSMKYINIHAALYDGRDVSGHRGYKSYTGSTTHLWNNAIESTGNGISVRIDRIRKANGTASGVWNPDVK